MAYEIIYAEQLHRKEKIFWLPIALVIAIILGCMMPRGVRDQIITWAREDAVQAFSDFRSDLLDGVAFEDAFLEYCMDIVDNGMEED